MSAAVTPFQLGVLFVMYKNLSTWYTDRELLAKCCGAALRTVSTGADADAEISSLLAAGYITDNSLDVLLRNEPFLYQISNDGIIFVRKSLLSIQDACRRGTIPEPVINEQNDKIADALHANSPNLLKLIVKYGIQSIDAIFKLVQACLCS